MTTTEATPLHTEILDFVGRTEKAFTDTGRRLGEAACGLLPVEADAVGRIVDQTFDFTESLLDGQRQFAASLIGGVLGGSSGQPVASKPRTRSKTTTE